MLLCADTQPPQKQAQRRNLSSSRAKRPLPHDALEPVLEPLDRLLPVDLVGVADLRLAASALGDALTGAGPIERSLVSIPIRHPHSQYGGTHMQQ